MSDPREAELLSIIEAQRRSLDGKDREIKLLRQKLDALARRIFGVKSEKLNKGQLELLLSLGKEDDPGKAQASVEAEAIPPIPHSPRRTHPPGVSGPGNARPGCPSICRSSRK